MVTYGKAIKVTARTHAPQYVHRLIVMTRADGTAFTPFAACASNLDGITDMSMTEADVTCPKCLRKLAKGGR